MTDTTTELIWYCQTCNVWYATIDADHEEQALGNLICNWKADENDETEAI